MYLNTLSGFENFLELFKGDIFIDKSMIIDILNNRLHTKHKYIYITRPRRFGKSEITFLIESYYSKAIDSKDIFDKLKISYTKSYINNLNKYNVIKIDFSEIDEDATYSEYIGRIKSYLISDLEKNYSHIEFDNYKNLSDKFLATGDKFIFIFDEWDFIFNKSLYVDKQESFLEFLRNLLKGRSYVTLCYMTGILPIKKHSSGSALNMFEEYTLLDDGIFEEYFGFTEEEVRGLCQANDMDYESLESWYNGYKMESGIKIFNPRSVSIALTKKKCKSYWVNTGAMNEVLEYLEIDPTGVRDDVLRMVNNEEVEVYDIEDFRAGQQLPQSKEEIYSAMITLGFLTYADYMVSIPNKELMQQFEKALRSKSFGKTAELFAESRLMLKATLSKDVETMAKILHNIHNREITLYDYNHENGLSSVVSLAYLSARDKYIIKKEEHSGKGRADFIFHPISSKDIPIIIELKRNEGTQTAINQILEREYATEVFERYKRNILIVGIDYTKDKDHSCQVIELEYMEWR